MMKYYIKAKNNFDYLDLIVIICTIKMLMTVTICVGSYLDLV